MGSKRMIRRFAGGQVCPPKYHRVYESMIRKAGREAMSQCLVEVDGKPYVFAGDYSYGVNQLVKALGGEFIGNIICLK